MKNRLLSIVAPILLITALVGPASAETLNNRLGNQHHRIEQGLRDHQINRYQAFNLSRRDMAIRRSERRDRWHDGGRLTAGERYRLNGRLNRVSHAIYRERHNGY